MEKLMLFILKEYATCIISLVVNNNSGDCIRIGIKHWQICWSYVTMLSCLHGIPNYFQQWTIHCSLSYNILMTCVVGHCHFHQIKLQLIKLTFS